MINPDRIRSFGDCLARTCVLLSVLVLVCVPGLTRMSQKLETASHAPSFAKNIDCPPKKVTVTPATAVPSPVTLANFSLVPLLRPAPVVDTTLPRSPYVFRPGPLRAPPAVDLV